MSFDDEAGRLVSTAFARLGRAASFMPAGASAVACTVTIDAPDVLAGLGEVRAPVADTIIRVAAAQLPRAPKQGDRFSVGGTIYHVVDRARFEDADRTVYEIPAEVRD